MKFVVLLLATSLLIVNSNGDSSGENYTSAEFLNASRSFMIMLVFMVVICMHDITCIVPVSNES